MTTQTLTPNTAELVAIYRYIVAHPQEWDQAAYAKRTACGTAYCVAGHAVVRAGWRLVWTDYGGGSWSTAALDGPRDDEGYPPMFGDVATALLGLTDDEAYALFDTENTLADIREHIAEITGVDPGGPPSDLQVARDDVYADLYGLPRAEEFGDVLYGRVNS